MEERAASKPPGIVALLDWIGISQARRQSLLNFFGWFKTPSNLLSVAAILAVVIVPWLDKLLKSDEELRTKINTLLESIDKVISMGQQEMSSAYDVNTSAIIGARRSNELARANAIATSIKHEVYPAVLFALSNELCASGQFDDGHKYLTEVLERGTGVHVLAQRSSNNDLSQAHVLNARCYAFQFLAENDTNSPYKKRANDEMAAAISLLELDKNDKALGQKAIAYMDWAKIADDFGNTAQAQGLRQKALVTSKAMHLPDPLVTALVTKRTPAQSPAPAPRPVLKDEDLPRLSDRDTYRIEFVGEPNDVAVLISPHRDADGRYSASVGATLYVYRNGLFTEAYEVDNMTTANDDKQLVAISFHKVVPRVSEKVELVLTIQSADGDAIIGVQSKVGRSPRSFVARRSIVTAGTPRAKTSRLQQSSLMQFNSRVF